MSSLLFSEIKIMRTTRGRSGFPGGEGGSALILAIIFMAILSILGAVVLQVANREIKMVSGYKAGGDYPTDRAGLLPEKEAFYLVDRTVEYSLNTRVIQQINDQMSIDPTDTELDFITDPFDIADPTGDKHKDVIEAGGGLLLRSGKIRNLGLTSLSFAQISRIASGASAKDIFIRYHLNASACPDNVDCAAYPKEAIRVDSQLVEVRPNPSGSSGSSEETGESIWGTM